MICGLHWTLWALVELCLGCLLLNWVQWRAVGTIRLSGILICAGWAIQQGWWAATGLNSLALTISCDLLLLAFFWCHRGANDWSDKLIAVLIPATMLVYIPEYLTSQTVTGWWAGWAIVVAQMLLGMPRGAKQRIPDKLARIQDRGKAHGVSFAFTRR